MVNAARLAWCAVLAVGLAACSSNIGKKADEIEPNIPPTNYKKEILDTMAGTLEDPTNVREAAMSEPVLMKISLEQRYAVCIRYNGRDSNRRYKGVHDSIAFFYAGHLNQLVDATPEQCGKAAYKPFPELEKLCVATKCD